MEGFATLPAFDDAAPALKTISEAGVAVGCLTVNSPEKTRSFLEGAGLAGFVDHIITAQEAGWCARLEYEHGDVFLGADVTGNSLVEVADKLISQQ